MSKPNIKIFNCDCVKGAKKHIKDATVDLIITDPPYGIEGHTLHKHYNRDEQYVVDGYVEVPKEQYDSFSLEWILEAERVLAPGGSIYVVSGYTNLLSILKALRQTSLEEVNHIIWKYNFGVFTKRKYVSSHYHILYYAKPPQRERTFNRFARFGSGEKDQKGGSLQYQDMEDVWVINREYKPGQRKNKNELPMGLLTKILQYSSNENDVVCDFFLGSFSTAKAAIGMNRSIIGFEINSKAFGENLLEVRGVQPGSLLSELKVGCDDTPQNAGSPWDDDDITMLMERYDNLRKTNNKKITISLLCKEFGRGRFSIEKILKTNRK